MTDPYLFLSGTLLIVAFRTRTVEPLFFPGHWNPGERLLQLFSRVLTRIGFQDPTPKQEGFRPFYREPLRVTKKKGFFLFLIYI